MFCEDGFDINVFSVRRDVKIIDCTNVVDGELIDCSNAVVDMVDSVGDTVAVDWVVIGVIDVILDDSALGVAVAILDSVIVIAMEMGEAVVANTGTLVVTGMLVVIGTLD